MVGKLISTKTKQEIEVDEDEKLSFAYFLNGEFEKTVNLKRVLGIGGEGIVLSQKMDTKENHYKNGWDEKKGRDVAVKFVKFEKYDYEDYLGPEEEDETGIYGGINGNGKWVLSQYFKRLRKLGDFRAATCRHGGYSRPYIDFGISEIHQKYYHVIGKLIIRQKSGLQNLLECLRIFQQKLMKFSLFHTFISVDILIIYENYLSNGTISAESLETSRIEQFWTEGTIGNCH